MNFNDTDNIAPAPKTTSAGEMESQVRGYFRRFAIGALFLVALFAVPLWQVIRHALRTDIQSHILLIPFVSWYLFRISKGKNRAVLRASFGAGAIAAVMGVIALAAYWHWGVRGRIAQNDALSLAMLSFLVFQLANALFTLGWPFLRLRFFAVAFLAFMIPLPLALTDFLSIGLQRASAEAADWMLSLTQIPFWRNGMVFQFSGLIIRVAQECSGVRSTFVLFITSLLAGHLFLRTGWKKIALALVIFPLGILRNGFRITVISWLSVNVDPRIIDGPLHHHGGPLFFVLSLVPLFVLLWWLRRSDLRKLDRCGQ